MHDGQPDTQKILRELKFITSRSGGPGGQNVNKVSSKVTVSWEVAQSVALTADERAKLLSRLGSRLTGHGALQVTSQRSRSQIDNKEEAIRKLMSIVFKALQDRKKRKPTRPSKTAVRKRLEGKKRQAEKKRLRGEY